MKIKIKRKDYENIWFMSDLHIGHQNVIKYGNRPFSGVIEMEEFVKKEFKRKVGKNDLLFDLGDLFWKADAMKVREIIPECKFFYKIIGNHDKENLYKLSLHRPENRVICSILDLAIFGENEKEPPLRAVLCHYPMLSWNHKPRGSFMIHGHCHGGIDQVNKEGTDLRVDVGWDASLSKEVGSFLISWEDLVKYFTKKTETADFKGYVEKKGGIL